MQADDLFEVGEQNAHDHNGIESLGLAAAYKAICITLF